MNLHINDFPENLVSFKSYKIDSCQLLWNENNFPKKLSTKLSKTSNKELIIDTFAYAMEGSKCLIGTKENTKSISMEAERYGGFGIGANGGGGRCGNYLGFQVKGTGKNALVGAHDNKKHSNGALSLYSAICEVIFNFTLNKVLPLGAVPVQCIISTGDKTAYWDVKIKDETILEETQGALLVRDIALRPAHFLTASKFKPYLEYKKSLYSETYRLKVINKKLNRLQTQNNSYLKYLAVFLERCAKQFAFARAARIMHTNLSPSNIAMDGRWLDFPGGGFVPSGHNYGLWPIERPLFYSQYSIPMKIVSELIYNFNKFNNTKLSIKELGFFYQTKFNEYFIRYIPFVFGLNTDTPSLLLNKEDLVVKTINNKIMQGKKPEDGRGGANLIADDGILKLIILSFKMLNKPDFLTTSDKNSIENFAKYFENFLHMLKKSYKAYTDKMSFDTFCKQKTITSIKRTVLASFYYSERIENYVRGYCEGADFSNVSCFIENCNLVAEWAFEPESLSVTVFKTCDISITLNAAGEYTLKIKNDPEVKYMNYSSLLSKIEQYPSDMFIFCDYNFTEYFNYLSATLDLTTADKFL